MNKDDGQLGHGDSTNIGDDAHETLGISSQYVELFFWQDLTENIQEKSRKQSGVICSAYSVISFPP